MCAILVLALFWRQLSLLCNRGGPVPLAGPTYVSAWGGHAGPPLQDDEGSQHETRRRVAFHPPFAISQSERFRSGFRIDVEEVQ